MGRITKNLLSISLTFILALSGVMFGIAPVEASASSLVKNIILKDSDWVTSGAMLSSWECQTKTGMVKINTLKIDLNNPYIKVGALYGRDGLTGNKQTVTGLTKESGAVAAINGDFFTLTAEGAPFGVTISEGQLINSPSYIPNKNALMIDYNNQPYIDLLDFDAFLRAANGESFRVYGINKTEYLGGYRLYGLESHYNRLHIYDANWNFDKWVGDKLLDKGGYAAAVITNNVVGNVYINEKPLFIPAGSSVVLGHGYGSDYIINNLYPGSSIKLDLTLHQDFPIRTAIDGSTLLVENGRAAELTSNVKGCHARSAIGYSKDKRYLYLVAVEKSRESAGMTLTEFTQFLIAQGIDKALNLDGGGSTALVTRPLGSFDRVNQIIPANVYERSVPNAFGVFTTAPAGKLLSYEIIMPHSLLINEAAVISELRMYDEYYNPITPGSLAIEWKLPANVSHSENFDASLGQLLISKAGKYTVKSIVSGITKTHELHTVGQAEIEAIEFVNASGASLNGPLSLQAGESYAANIQVTFKDGTKRMVAPHLLNWKLTGVGGNVDESGTITIMEPSQRTLIASYDGYSASLPLSIGDGGVTEEDPLAKREIRLVLGQKKAKIAEQEISLDQAPLVKDGRTYIPIRAVTELLGAYVEWISEEQKVDIIYDLNIYQLWLNKPTINAAGLRDAIDAAPFVTKGRTMVPVRALSESFGLYVDYNSQDRSITIKER